MKCPKCGYNSFEYNDNCPKCLKDLTAYKAAHGLKAMALPPSARTEMARSMAVEAGEVDHPAKDADTTSEIFSFDFEENEPANGQWGGGPAHDPFNLEDEPATSPQGKEDAFGGLLEKNPQKSPTAPAGKPAAVDNAFDLNNFSWDDAPDPAADGKPENSGKPGDDGFESLFGGPKK